MKEANWFEKEFDFNLPLEAFPGVMERLRGTPARLEEMVRSYPAGILTMRAGDAWSIKEHIGHLSDLEDLHDGRLEDYAASAEVLRAADPQNRITYEANHNEQPVEALLALFRTIRTHFVSHLEAMDDAEVARSAFHPRLRKQMRVIDLAQFVAEHDDHHLSSITRLSRELKP